MTRKAQLETGFIIGVLVITLLAVGYIMAPILGVQGETLGKIFGGSGPEIGSWMEANIDLGYDFDGRGTRASLLGSGLEGQRAEYDVDYHYWMYAEGRPGYPEWDPKHTIQPMGTALIYDPTLDGKENADLDCSTVGIGHYTDKRSRDRVFVVGKYVCVITDKNHVVKVRMLQAEPKPRIKYIFQSLGYEEGIEGLGRVAVDIIDENLKYTVVKKDFTSSKLSNVPDGEEITWYGYDFDRETGITDENLDKDQEKVIDIWYNNEYGLYFWGCNVVHTSEKVGHYQQAYYVGGTDSVKCDEIAPTMYHPNQGEIGYSPPVHKDAYYCVITSENRVAKVHWLGEEGDGWFEWWFE